jgi:hypothetical protein
METTVDLNETKLNICPVAVLPAMRRAMKEELKVNTVIIYKIN